LWARRRTSTEAFADTAATVAATPAELGAASDIVCLCVVADADVEDVLLRPDGVLTGMAPGGVVVLHSTIHPDTCRRVADEAAKREIAVVDAPVSGGGAAAAERRLLVMAGGQEADVARCRPVFDAFADPVIHLGPLGSGQLAKLLNNFVFTAQVGLAGHLLPRRRARHGPRRGRTGARARHRRQPRRGRPRRFRLQHRRAAPGPAAAAQGRRPPARRRRHGPRPPAPDARDLTTHTLSTLDRSPAP